MGNDFNILIKKLDRFIRKYYKNQMLKGLLISVSLYITFYLFVTVTEYFSHFSTEARTVIFYSVIGVFAAVFVWMILIPFLKFNKIGKTLNHKQAAVILSVHFDSIRDKLQNTLELAELVNMNPRSRDLILASIDQRIDHMHPIPFTNAINLKENLRYLKFLVPLIITILFIYFYSPSVLREGTERIINHQTLYAPVAPYSFIVLNDSLVVQKGGDFEIDIKVEGSYVPDNVSIAFGGNTFLMKKESNSKFSYNLKRINNSIDFNFVAEDYFSDHYNLRVLPAPVIVDFSVELDVPEYTGEDDRTLKNIGDITIPYGTIVKWNFNTRDIDNLTFTFYDTLKIEADRDTLGFTTRKTMYESSLYKIAMSNKYFTGKDELKYTINVVPDLFPAIRVNTAKDSIEYTVSYFRGIINDDYGFKNLYFCYKTDPHPDSINKLPLQFSRNLATQEFYHMFDFKTLSNVKSDKIEYFFEVWDNDAISGSKSARSGIYEYKIPSQEEIEKLEAEASAGVQSKMEQSMKMAKELQKDVAKLREELINNKMTSWEKNQMIEQMSQKQKSLEQMMEQLAEQNAQKNEMMNSFNDKELEIMKKQEEIQNLLENLMDEELKKLLDEFNEMMEEFDQDKLSEMAEDMEMSLEDLSEQLDRNMELLKQMEVEKDVENVIDKLEKLAEEQKELSEETDSRKLSDEQKEDALKKQQEQGEKFDKLKDEYEKALEKNKELENPMSLEDFKEGMEEIDQEFNKGEENLNNDKPQKASENQQQNSQKMQEMADKMHAMMQMNSQQQAGENMDDLRQIIDNLVTFSFDQEALMVDVKGMHRKDPKYPEMISIQNKLSEDFGVIQDSLQALGKRTSQLTHTITKEIEAIDRNISKSVSHLEERNTSLSSQDQQFVMTSANNLALLLSEVLKSMQEQAAQQMQGSSSCNKPGSNPKPGLGEMKGKQQGMKQQLESLINQMKQQGKGEGSKFDKKALNKRLAEMLAEQEVFRQSMGELMKSGNFSPETMKKLNDVNKMIEQNESDLVNKSVTPITLKRQEMIVTRLLEAENSEYQREIDKKRESKSGKSDKFSNPEEIFQYKGVNSRFNELLNVSNVKLNKYYKQKFKEYLLKLNEN